MMTTTIASVPEAFIVQLLGGGPAAQGLLADWLEDQGDPRADAVRGLPAPGQGDLARAVWRARQERRVHPTGTFDRGRWFPGPREDCGDFGRVRAPSARWPYSYMARARTLDHCTMLARNFLGGDAAPWDVGAVYAGLWRVLLGPHFPEYHEGVLAGPTPEEVKQK